MFRSYFAGTSSKIYANTLTKKFSCAPVKIYSVYILFPWSGQLDFTLDSILWYILPCFRKNKRFLLNTFVTTVPIQSRHIITEKIQWISYITRFPFKDWQSGKYKNGSTKDNVKNESRIDDRRWRWKTNSFIWLYYLECSAQTRPSTCIYIFLFLPHHPARVVTWLLYWWVVRDPLVVASGPKILGGGRDLRMILLLLQDECSLSCVDNQT